MADPQISTAPEVTAGVPDDASFDASTTTTALPRRWIVKDVAGLYFSALHIGLNRQDFLRFVRGYSGKSVREALREDARFWNEVQRKALQLDRKINH